MKADNPNTPNFDERAKANMQKISHTHEFRKNNIAPYKPLDKDYFEYDPSDKRKYDSMKFEHLFRFNLTYKAIRWGVFVGGLFAFHRYYRSRDIMNAAHWFTCVSFISFFNIWLSYGIQDFVTDYASRKSRSLASRNEYHTNVYKNYLDDVSEAVEPIDNNENVTPVLHNSSVESLNTFANNYDEYLLERFKMNDNDIDYDDEEELQDIKFLRNTVESRNILNQRDKSKEELKKLIESIEKIDRKGMDFSKDIFNLRVY